MLPKSRFAEWALRVPAIGYLRSRRAEKLITQGDRARDAGHWRQASEAYADALKLVPARAPIWVQYGHASKECGDHAGGEAAYRRAMRAGLDDADIHLQLGHVLKLQGQFADSQLSYAEALKRDPGHPDVMQELSDFGWTRADFRVALPGMIAPPLVQANDARRRETVAFDVSDVLAYMATSRRPTGIQRVQLNLVGALLEDERFDVDVMLLCFARTSSYWVEISRDMFRDVIALMARNGDSAAPEWQQLRRDVTAHCLTADDANIPVGARLINLGSSWAFGNYALAVRRAKKTRNVTYIPFVHDCIPILDPDSFVPELQRDFREWVASILSHADGFLANSQSTASDFHSIAAMFGYSDILVQPVPLDATFSTPAGARSDDAAQILQRFGLSCGQFVLFVATIEPRKNHLLAFDAWERQLKADGKTRVPDLVCVGGRGWCNGAILRRLESSAFLRDKVHILHGVSDIELEQLYRACRFTIYPSRYEGWGLPVTESLSYGKVPLIARSSSLPEAGGPFAEYFDLDDGNDLSDKLARLVDDTDYLHQREQVIRTGFRTRSWRQIADDVMERCLAMTARPRPELAAPTLPAATFVRLAKDRAGAQASGVMGGEIYRDGAGWSAQDERGCWISDAGDAELVFTLPCSVRVDPAGFRVYLLIYGGACRDVQSAAEDRRDHILKLHLENEILGSFGLTDGAQRWVMVQTKVPKSDTVRIRLTAESRQGQMRRGAAIGLRGIYVCADSDADARMRFVEGAALGAIDEPMLDGHFPDRAEVAALPTKRVAVEAS